MNQDIGLHFTVIIWNIVLVQKGDYCGSLIYIDIKGQNSVKTVSH